MNLLTSSRSKDYCGGVILILMGASAALTAQNYRIGSLNRMGPGYFPAALGILLALTGLTLIGVGMARRARQAAADAGPAETHPPEWRGWLCICLGVVAFAIIGNLLGLVPATFACVFIAAMGDHDNRPRDALLLAIGVTLAGVAVFWWGLGIQFPLFSKDFM
ncbi:tripartite tricarboxylate transporter TctB family protein [Roseomonas sp. 573]|uniref:Tripartite tricarboxylate transporter TctB family protein n=2 Tax=Roseomonas haemaphysalidis TaxID=2768162 RepID=A0ABS3KKY4_9PROT|nr:tripartite tricarboxylate transporter TctB family protein [Roseomonas haemaphysalidis]MBO1078134.1 tripartite tricarboxylate transporter TctB family protein [Roseomonas haemaphysalidis]